MSLYIEHPITGEQIQVAESDFPDKMTWDQAMSACAGLGNGWRLPNQEELEAMYLQLHKQGKGNFKEVFYWSSLQGNSGSAWVVYFFNGDVYDGYSFGKFHDRAQVRAVRAL